MTGPLPSQRTGRATDDVRRLEAEVKRLRSELEIRNKVDYGVFTRACAEAADLQAEVEQLREALIVDDAMVDRALTAWDRAMYNALIDDPEGTGVPAMHAALVAALQQIRQPEEGTP